MESLSITLDANDYKLLDYLAADARMSLSAIARELGLDTRTVKKKLDRLLDSGCFKLSVVTYAERLGYDSMADIVLEVTADAYEQVIETCLSYDCVYYLGKGWGVDKLLVQANCLNNDELNSFVYNTLANMRGVTIKNVVMITDIIRDGTSWLPPKSLE